jgi:hypothetical protein
MYVPNRAAQYREALVAPVRDVTMRVTALDSNYNTIVDVTQPSVEGVVYVDVERATRRTAQIRLINKDGAYTPKGSDYATYGTNALFWWNKMFRLEYGLKVAGVFEYVPLGVFMIDRTEVLAERGISVINIDGSDQWKRMAYSTWAAPAAYAKNVDFNTIIADIATAAGIPANRLLLDSLSTRSTTEKQVQVPVFFEEGDNRGEKLAELCADWNLEIFFDVDGYLRTRDLKVVADEIQSKAPDWTFTSGEDAVMLNITKSKTSEQIKNHVVVTGEAEDGTAVVRGEWIDDFGTDTASKKYTNVYSQTSVSAIGDRVLAIRSKTLRTTQGCLDLAQSELRKSAVVEEEIALPSIVNPLFEGRDVIEIIESNSDTNDKYYLGAFDIPMRSSTQEIHVKKVRVL